MSNEELEKLVLTAMKKELSLIVNLGAVIGFVFGMCAIIDIMKIKKVGRRYAIFSCR